MCPSEKVISHTCALIVGLVTLKRQVIVFVLHEQQILSNTETIIFNTNTEQLLVCLAAYLKCKKVNVQFAVLYLIQHYTLIIVILQEKFEGCYAVLVTLH